MTCTELSSMLDPLPCHSFAQIIQISFNNNKISKHTGFIPNTVTGNDIRLWN